MTATINLIHVGLGLIGSAAIGILRQQRPRWEQDYGISLNFRSFIDSSGGVACDETGGYSEQTIDRLIAARASGVKAFDAAPAIGLTPRSGLEARVLALSMGPAIVIDCATGPHTAAHSANAIEMGYGAVFSNKAPLALPIMDDASEVTWNQARMGGRVRYETSCGAGLPVISTLRSLLDTGDRVLSISGALSGTLGAIFADVAAGSPFSQAVQSAKNDGYTEPDPRDDLSGLDVARKALILARTIGMPVDLDEITVESLVPARLQDVTVPEFMKQISASDSDMSTRASQATAEGRSLKYVASVDPENGVSVGIRSISKETVLGSLQGPENVITIRTERYDAYPLTVAGPGAGAVVTAAGVVADVLSVSKLMKEH
ncbi:homoserine dehydrogenase [soil metagenome]